MVEGLEPRREYGRSKLKYTVRLKSKAAVGQQAFLINPGFFTIENFDWTTHSWPAAMHVHTLVNRSDVGAMEWDGWAALTYLSSEHSHKYIAEAMLQTPGRMEAAMGSLEEATEIFSTAWGNCFWKIQHFKCFKAINRVLLKCRI